MRVHGAEDPNTLMTAGNLALSLTRQGKYAHAERIQREVLGVQKRVFGAEHPSTLTSASNLASYLAGQNKYVEAEQILQATLASSRRVLGPAHPNTLQTASNLEHVRAAIRASLPTNAAAPAAAPAALVDRQHARALAVVLGLGDEPLHQHARADGQSVPGTA